MGTSPPGHVHFAIDLGNTAAKAAVFHGGKLMGPTLRFNYTEWQRADEWVTNHGVENIVYSSVANVPPPELLDKWTAEGRRVVTLQAAQALPFPSQYATPETLGQDRIAAIMAVLGGTTSRPATKAPITAPSIAMAKLVVDVGTCVTADLIDPAGLHLGGNISPGLRMRLQAMHEHTARLPLPDLGNPEGIVGDRTVTALRHGGGLGLVYELEGLYRRLQQHYPHLKLLLTGGDAPWVAGKLSIPCSHYPHLVLYGLIQILSYYAPNES